jgi:mannose-6-phosphate isomerase
MLYPLTFHPVFKERVWGGRQLATLYGKALPAGAPIGESWEITDRPEGVSVIANGPLAGRDLRWLMEHHRAELLGDATPANGRFPLLCKLIDAQQDLSLQVHPPAAQAAALGGEPKTEAWYFADTTPGAQIFVGLKRGVTRAEFERRVRDGAVAECFHRHAVKRGDAMFLPSGRVHALGAGCVIFEIQQNSDTTYRVFDWNRVGLDGQPRALHLEPALASIDFQDFEPALVDLTRWEEANGLKRVALAACAEFSIHLCQSEQSTSVRLPLQGPGIVAVLDGMVACTAPAGVVALTPGGFALLPAGLGEARLDVPSGTRFLWAVAL